MFTPSHLKQARFFLESVQKFISYKKDILKPEKLERIQELRGAFEAKVKAKASKEELETASEELTKVCETSVPAVTDPGTRDWVESLLTCAVIVFAIRAYFVQPFKIPTGSMQPTLNGIIATPNLTPKPNIFKQAYDFVSRGRNHVHVLAPKDGTIVKVQQTSLLLFSYSTVSYSDGTSFKVYAPARQLCGTMAHGDFPLWNADLPMLQPVKAEAQTGRFEVFQGQCPVKKGDVVASGFVDAGDMVLVDKISYHFRKPHRGEVFVFNTKNIGGVQSGVDPREGSQHYIKRLVGVPGDKLSVETPNLFVNGQLADAPGCQRVMQAQDGYRGYQGASQGGGGFPFMPYECRTQPRDYFAMGDNSYNSSDSRYWGRVPEENLVGPGLFSLWPITTGHWGLIK